MNAAEIERASARLERASARERLSFAVDTFGDDLLFTSSFGASSAALLHLWSEVAEGRPVVFLDTGFHFPETLAYRDALATRLSLSVTVLTPAVTRERFLAERGSDVQRTDPDACCAVNKLAPLAPLRESARGWVSGLRRDQASTRRAVSVLERDGHLVRVHPLADFSEQDVRAYMRVHDLPDHPLTARRFLSIGCAPCTRAVAEGEDPRAGRWAWGAKTECGLHTARAGGTER
jgi:phosphoadenosine phosphosulfate reductase